MATSIKIRFVVVDTITGNEVSDLYRFEEQAQEQIKSIEQNDKEAGCYEPDSYIVQRVETI